MRARALFREGRLDAAVEALNAELRSSPTDSQRRTFLFELLCFAGDYDRAGKQLDILARGGRDAALGSVLYQSALHGERVRQTMFAEGDYPGTRLEPVAGVLNGTPFQRMEDADPRVGARFEIFAAGQYTWIPMAQVASLRIAPPAKLRDLLWAPAALMPREGFKGGDLGEILIPMMSPLSWRHGSDAVRLGRVTEWEDLGGGAVAPLGQKMLLVDGEEFPFLEVRELEVTPNTSGGNDTSAAVH